MKGVRYAYVGNNYFSTFGILVLKGNVEDLKRGAFVSECFVREVFGGEEPIGKTLSRRAKMVGVHKCSGATTGNIFSMFLLETALVVLMSVCVAVFLILNNAQELIGDLLSVSLSDLFTWENLWVALLYHPSSFPCGRCLFGRLFSRIPVTQVFHRYTKGKKGWKRSLLLCSSSVCRL